MTEDERGRLAQVADEPDKAARLSLPGAARRALAEAEQRRSRKAGESDVPAEVEGRGGLDPVRYGDWEVKGLATDF